MQKKIFFGMLIFILVLISAFLVQKSQAGLSNNASGWAQGWQTDLSGMYSGPGWISMNSTNCDIDGDGVMDRGGGDSAASGLCPPNGAAVPDYGVDIPTGDGDFSGPGYYAWSSNYGWISFNPADVAGCPSGNPCQARREGNAIKGWARILSLCDGPDADESCSLGETNSNAGGFDGWISLSSLNCDTDGNTSIDNCPPFSGNMPLYGVDTTMMGSASNFAWSNEFGYVDFKGVYIGALGCVNLCSQNSCIGNIAQICGDGNGDGCTETTGTIDCTTLGAGFSCQGQGNCVCTPTNPSCTAADTCSGETCNDGCTDITGTKNCLNTGNWKEVAP